VHRQPPLPLPPSPPLPPPPPPPAIPLPPSFTPHQVHHDVSAPLQGCQSVYHVHIHVIGGKQVAPKP
jgi:hypothetical protein